jgi:hypothetical protein
MRALLAAALLLLAARPARAAQPEHQDGRFGAGLLAGVPSGLTAKYWVNDRVAFAGGGGYGDDALILYWDILLNSWDLITTKTDQGRMNAYLGGGPRFSSDNGGQAYIRLMAGGGYWPAALPLEIFAEVGPAFKLSAEKTGSVDGGIGVRYYFTRFHP